MKKDFFSTMELAKILGITRIAVFKKIKKGEIQAIKVGRNFVIGKSQLPEILGTVLSEDRKKEIEKTVRKTVAEYGEALKLLGRE
jgi:excisionase family DNA binding protein